jgi:hypothetical protein
VCCISRFTSVADPDPGSGPFYPKDPDPDPEGFFPDPGSEIRIPNKFIPLRNIEKTKILTLYERLLQ